MLVALRPPLEQVLELLGQPGVYAILWQLAGGPLRYGALQQLTDLPPRALSMRLKDLEEVGLILRTEYAEVPPRVEYSLTPKGQRLYPSLQALAQWEDSAT